MSTRLLLAFVLAIPICAQASSSSSATPDYSKEATVIQKIATTVKFAADGTREWHQTSSVRIQSEAAIRQLGILSISYNAGNEKPEIEYVRVKKADGSVVETPISSAMDVATEVAAAAPTYNDLRQRQIPVRGLGVGDVLEYSVRSSQVKPEVPDQFWYEQTFIDDSVVLEQTLEVSVPKDKYVQVSSPKLKSDVHTEGDQVIYFWKHSHLALSQTVDQKKQAEAKDEAPRVQLTTFRSWEELGNWWGKLAADQEIVTPEIQKKAQELTAGLTTDEAKARAIYKYVAMQFRYISISFGMGRYRPHSAAEVFLNQYGDCKDKHALFAALLKAVGVDAWPALIGVGIKFDPAVPSPAQFNHVITVLPEKGNDVWLDTTAEVAPFGALSQELRDQDALLIPFHGKPVMMKTPVALPFRATETIDVNCSLSAEGTLTGDFDFSMLNDDAVAMRAGFYELAPTQWQVFVQQMSYALGYAGEVSGVEVESLEDLDKPLHYRYHYRREKYSDWAEHKITPPLPPLIFGPGEEAERPKEAFWVGSPGELVYRASLRLPQRFSAVLPPDAKLASAFADYTAHYSLQDGVLKAERKMAIHKAKVELSEWTEYQKFIKDVRADQTQFMELKAIEEGNAQAEQLIERARQAVQNHDLQQARRLLAQAEQQSPQQMQLWAWFGIVDAASGNRDKAMEDCRKELQYHPKTHTHTESLLCFWRRRAAAMKRPMCC